MSDLLLELDEAMRQERVEKFFHEHGKTVIAFIVATIVMTAAVSGYKHWNAGAQERGTSALIALLDDPAFPDNIQTAELDMRGGLRGMALLSAGGALLDEGKTEEALTTYKRAMNDRGVAKDFKQLATIMVVRLDQDAATKPLQLLQPIWNDKSSPWRHSARLEAAAILANRDAGFAGALTHLKTVMQSENLPDTILNRASALHHIYTLKQQQAAQDS